MVNCIAVMLGGFGFPEGRFETSLTHARTPRCTHAEIPKNLLCLHFFFFFVYANVHTHFFFSLSFLMFESSPESKTQITHRNAINTHNFLLLHFSSFLFHFTLKLVSFNFCLLCSLFYDFRLISISPLRFSLWIIEGWVGKFHFVVYIFTHNTTLSHSHTHARTHISSRETSA